MLRVDGFLSNIAHSPATTNKVVLRLKTLHCQDTTCQCFSLNCELSDIQQRKHTQAFHFCLCLFVPLVAIFCRRILSIKFIPVHWHIEKSKRSHPGDHIEPPCKWKRQHLQGRTVFLHLRESVLPPDSSRFQFEPKATHAASIQADCPWRH